MAIESHPDAEKDKAAPVPVIGTTGIVADRDMYLSEDEHTIVEKGDEKARFLFAARGSMIDPQAIAARGLSVKGGKIVQAKAGEEGAPKAPAGAVNEGQLRAAGEPLILAPRTGVLRGEMAPRSIPELGDEIEVSPTGKAPVVAVSNVPKEDDEFRAKVAAETGKEKPEAEPKPTPAKPAARKAPAAKKVARRPKGK